MSLAVATPSVIILTNSAMLTALLTSGLMALVVLLYAMPDLPERMPKRRDSARQSGSERKYQA